MSSNFNLRDILSCTNYIFGFKSQFFKELNWIVFSGLEQTISQRDSTKIKRNLTRLSFIYSYIPIDFKWNVCKKSATHFDLIIRWQTDNEELLVPQRNLANSVFSKKTFFSPERKLFNIPFNPMTSRVIWSIHDWALFVMK